MITIRPESDGRTLVVEAGDKLTTKDYEEVFIPELERLMAQYGKIRLVFFLNDSFDGWEVGAMWDDAKFGMKHRNDIGRIAMVGGPGWLSWITGMSSHFLPEVIRQFDGESIDQAIDWVSS